jgi:hypothetical protein
MHYNLKFLANFPAFVVFGTCDRNCKGEEECSFCKWGIFLSCKKGFSAGRSLCPILYKIIYGKFVYEWGVICTARYFFYVPLLVSLGLQIERTAAPSFSVS